MGGKPLHTIVLLYMGDETITASAGTERVLSNMANALVERGYRVIVVTNDETDAKPYFPLHPDVRLVFLDVRQDKPPFFVKMKREINRVIPIMDRPVESYRASLSVRKIKESLQDCQVDCIIAYNHEAIQVADRWKQGRVPIIAMMHNAIRVIMGNSNPVTLREKERASVIQVLMPSYVEEARRYIHDTPIVWIPNTVDPIPVGRMAHPGAEKAVHTIITVGRIDGLQKQTHILVHSFAKLAAAYPDWQVEIWGEIKKKSYYEKLCRFVQEHHLERQIHFCGTTKNVQKQLRRADIFAFPSAFEGFSLALTEAMAVGLPSVGFRTADAVNELIVDGKNGILCEDGEVAFAKGLETLMKDGKLRERMGRQAVEEMKPYAPDSVWDKWQELIEQQIQVATCQKE